MNTRIPNLRELALPGAFALLCVILTLLTLRSFGGSLPLEPTGYRVDVPLPQAANIVTGSDVQIAGVDVGKVVGVERRGSGAVASLELKESFAPLRSRANAIARTKTLLGEGYVEIAPGPADAPAIPEGGRIQTDHVQSSVQLDEFLSTFDPGTRRRMRDLFGGLAGTLEGHAPEALNDSLGAAAPFTAGLSDVVEVLDDERASLREVLASSARVFDALGEREGALAAAVSAGNDVLEVTAGRDEQLAATVRALPSFLRRLETTADTISETSPELNRAVRSLVGVTPQVAPTLAEIREAAPSFRGLFNELPATIAAGEQGLPALTRMIPPARAAFKEFYPTSRELLPFLQLLAVDRNALLILANVASVNAGNFVGPDGRVLGYATGLPTIWNETISGWKRKLPTNRQNPYPKPPDALLDTGRLGVLKSYDCRNTGNPLYLPPTGDAPPCLQQRPWTFNGVKAYYPRLKLAPP